MPRSWSTDLLAVIMAVFGAAALAVAGWLVTPAAGVAVVGVSLLAAAYVIRYLEVRREAS